MVKIHFNLNMCEIMSIHTFPMHGKAHFEMSWTWEAFCKKNWPIWSIVSKVMPFWISMHTLWSNDHNGHELGLFGKGRQRSTTFLFTKNSFETSLTLTSQVECGPKTCQIWKLWITGHFPFLVTFAMTFESSRWKFRMMNRPHLNMIEVSQLISPPHSPQLTAQLTFGPQMTLKCLD